MYLTMPCCVCVSHSDWLRGLCEEGQHFAVYLFIRTKHSQKAGPFSVARLKVDLPFHNRLAYSRLHRRSASPLAVCTFLIGGTHRSKPARSRYDRGA